MQIVGRAKISLGELGEVATEKGATLNIGGTKRNTVPADNGRTYHNEETTAPEMSCKVLATKDVSIEKLRDISGATAMFEADTGQKWMLVKAFTTDVPGLDAGSGMIDLTMSAEVVEEV